MLDIIRVFQCWNPPETLLLVLVDFEVIANRFAEDSKDRLHCCTETFQFMIDRRV